jgi:hypothetical protein
VIVQQDAEIQHYVSLLTETRNNALANTDDITHASGHDPQSVPSPSKYQNLSPNIYFNVNSPRPFSDIQVDIFQEATT